MIKNILSFDIGGTFIKYGIVNSRGKIIFKNKNKTPENNKTEIINFIKNIALNLKSIYNIDKISISIAGIVNTNGLIVFSPNIKYLENVNLKEEIYKNTNIETFIENDVNCATLGELWYGSGKDKENFIMITFGTGIGGAIVLNGKLLKGANNGAGEIGHMIINENGQLCNCGNRGCYEKYSSISALIDIYYKETCEQLTAEEIIKKAENLEEPSLTLYNEFINHVVTGIKNLTYILDTGLIIIGGNICKNNKFLKDINYKFKESVLPFYKEKTKIIKAKLDNDASLYGAAYLALKYKV